MLEPLAALTTYLQTHLKEYLGKYHLTGAALVVAGLVQKTWDKIDTHTMSQVMTAATIPAIYFSNSPLAPICIPLLSVALIVSTLKRQQEMTALRNQNERLSQIQSTDHEVTQAASEVNQKLDSRLLGLETKLQSLTSLCTQVMQNKQIADQLTATPRVEEEMTKLIAACRELQEKIAGVTQGICATEEEVKKFFAEREQHSHDIEERERKIREKLKGRQT